MKKRGKEEKHTIKDLVIGVVNLLLFWLLIIFNSKLEIGFFHKFVLSFSSGATLAVYVIAIIIVIFLCLFFLSLISTLFDMFFSKNRENKKSLFLSSSLSTFNIVPIIINIILIIDTFLFSSVETTGPSMKPTISDSATVVVSHKNIHNLEDGEIIILNVSESTGNDIWTLVIKRVWAKEGDTIRFVEISNNAVLIVNGESYVVGKARSDFKYINYDYTLKSGEVFVIGDNYDVSLDSRTRGILKTEGEEINAKYQGKAIFSFNPFGFIKNENGEE
ncbi:MAG: signal peptidase I [Gammaproteobacteria bacterium]|nr:signal peptidase I [Gammaproteobacteria bacterium]